MKKAKETIVQHIHEQLGLEVDPKKVYVEPITCERQFIPFFNNSISDEHTWRNEEKTFKLKLNGLNIIKSRSGIPRFPNIKSLTTVVNPNTDNIFKLETDWPEEIPHIAPFPDAIEEERQLRMAGEEFVSLPDFVPTIDFYNALKTLDIHGPISPGSAKQVMAYNVIHKTEEYSDRPVWIVQTRGIVPIRHGYQGRGGYVPEDARNHMRHIIDAESGQWLYSDTLPQPVTS